MRAAILGGAEGVWREYEEAKALAGGFDLVIAVNHAARDFEGRVDHWATYHPELLPRWIEERCKKGLPPAGAYWTVEGRRGPDEITLHRVPKLGGSSGMIAAQVAMKLGADRIVLCGVPLDAEAEHFDRRGPWTEAVKHRQAWKDNARAMDGIVKSMAGFTAELLGRPTAEWLACSFSAPQMRDEN